MYLEKIELQGFKSFAERTILAFPKPHDGRNSITIIVGPNGSGKSNVADAIKWVLGEQSMKTIRGKKAEDVIFSGSEKRARLGFAQVSLFLNNEDGAVPIEYKQLEISRRLYRDGKSEYLINKNNVRLLDISLLLAKAHFGQKSFSIISQGMIDNVLLATPLERKDFFDEAVGVKEFQIKRRQALLKLERSEENLAQASLLVREIEPQLRSLTRQVKKLEKREELQASLREYQQEYYHRLWAGLQTTLTEQKTTISQLNEQKADLDRQVQDKRSALEVLERSDSRSQVFGELQQQLSSKETEKNRLLREMTILKGRMEVDLEKQGKLNLAWLYRQEEDITGRIQEVQKEIALVKKEHQSIAVEKKNALARVGELKEKMESLSKKIERITSELKDEATRGPLTIVGRRVKEIVITYQTFLKRLNKGDRNAQDYMQKMSEEADAVMAQLMSLGDVIKEQMDASKTEEQVAQSESQELWQLQQDLNMAIEEHDKVQSSLNSIEVKLKVTEEKLSLKERDHNQLQQELARVTSDLSAQQQAETGKGPDKSKIQAQQDALNKDIHELDEAIAAIQGKIDGFNQEEEEKKSEMFKLEREHQALQQQLNRLMQKLHSVQVEMARTETKLEDLEVEIIRELDEITVVKARPDNTETDFADLPINHLFSQIEKLKYQLELIGGIDPETVTEYEQVKERHEFLTSQIADLEEAMKKLEKVIQELDKTIITQFDKAFQSINKSFEKYFQILFGGGRAKLIKMMEESDKDVEAQSPAPSEQGDEDPTSKIEEMVEEEKQTKSKKYQRSDYQGIDIYASPAGKRLASIGMLSGGERTLTSIALIAAIISFNPSPFVLMDEVDAALDEANSQRISKVIEDLVTKTQFIMITHNRTVMNIADTIYGVTMKEGVSKLLSVKLEDVDKHATRL